MPAAEDIDAADWVKPFKDERSFPLQALDA